jgi:hypothetical protein
MEQADIYRHLARGLYLKLSTDRRCTDPTHTWFVSTLYEFVSDPEHLPEDVYAAMRRYPWDGQLTQEMRIFVVSHRLRMKINKVMNERFIRPQPGAILIRASGVVPNALNQPQDMYLVRGQTVIGCSQTNHKILNGVHYDVKEVTALVVVVQMTERYRTQEATSLLQGLISLTHREASDSLRLLHAQTYRSAQGCTIRDTPVLLMDTRHKYLDHRMLIVGLSRVERGSQLRVATHEQQEAAFGFCGRPGRAEFDPESPLDEMLSQIQYSNEDSDESDEEEQEDAQEQWRPREEDSEDE